MAAGNITYTSARKKKSEGESVQYYYSYVRRSKIDPSFYGEAGQEAGAARKAR